MRLLNVLAVLVVAATAAECDRRPAARQAAATSGDRDLSPVQGPSLLKKLGLSVDETLFGKLGGSAPAAPTGREEPMPPLPQEGGRSLLSRLLGGGAPAPPRALPFVLTGQDIYRLSCQSCHGPRGAGSPPQVNSLVGPVEGTSTDLLVRRIRAAGRPVNLPFLRGVAADAANDLRQRIEHGGEKMPAFDYLSATEVDALLISLERMVGTPEAPASDARLTVPADEVGTLVVRGTCHICHDATGPGRHAMMMGGPIPSLASLPGEETFDDVVNKVRDGIAPSMMMMMSGGPSQMPRLPFLTREELAAAMRYLTAYRPQP